MIKSDHSDCVVAPNIYLDIKRNDARTGGMHSTFFDIQTRKYEVTEGGGMISGSEHRGPNGFLVKLSENTYTCGVPQLIHVPCPHIIGVCNLLGGNYYVSPFMANYTMLEALVQTWSHRFVLFLDEEQWDPYNGPRYVADKAMMWKKKCPRRRARYTMEMDCVKPACSKWMKVNSEYVEDRYQICCSKCHKAGYNVETTWLLHCLHIHCILSCFLTPCIIYSIFLIYLYIAFCLIYVYIL
jgi:hypothetical protein